MSGNIKVNTAIVKSTAESIKTINNNIDNDFNTVINSVNKLKSSWNGSASTKAMSKFDSIKKSYYSNSNSSRKAIMNSYVSFLLQAVSSDYETTETNNQALSELFK